MVLVFRVEMFTMSELQCRNEGCSKGEGTFDESQSIEKSNQACVGPMKTRVCVQWELQGST